MYYVSRRTGWLGSNHGMMFSPTVFLLTYVVGGQVRKGRKVCLGTIHYVSTFLEFLDPLPPRKHVFSQFLVLKISKNWHFLTPPPPTSAYVIYRWFLFFKRLVLLHTYLSLHPQFSRLSAGPARTTLDCSSDQKGGLKRPLNILYYTYFSPFPTKFSDLPPALQGQH